MYDFRWGLEVREAKGSIMLRDPRAELMDPIWYHLKQA